MSTPIAAEDTSHRHTKVRIKKTVVHKTFNLQLRLTLVCAEPDTLNTAGRVIKWIALQALSQEVSR